MVAEKDHILAFNLAKSVCLPKDMEHHNQLNTELKAIRSSTKSMILVGSTLFCFCTFLILPTFSSAKKESFYSIAGHSEEPHRTQAAVGAQENVEGGHGRGRSQNRRAQTRISEDGRAGDRGDSSDRPSCFGRCCQTESPNRDER